MNAKKTKYPSENCDEACFYHCTKGGQQDPECVVINNNGWIRIESKSDLPKDNSINYHALNIEFPDDIEVCLRVEVDERFTHYQPIIKPQPPIY